MQTKTCSKCHELIHISSFYRQKCNKDGYMGYCKRCREEQLENNRLMYPEHYDEIRKRKIRKQSEKNKGEYYKHVKNQNRRNRTDLLKREFLQMYGYSCKCCGETLYEFLTVEHVLGQVGIKNKDYGNRSYKNALAEYRPDVYETLCMNCNFSKGKYGYCPHQKENK